MAINIEMKDTVIYTNWHQLDSRPYLDDVTVVFELEDILSSSAKTKIAVLTYWNFQNGYREFKDELDALAHIDLVIVKLREGHDMWLDWIEQYDTYENFVFIVSHMQHNRPDSANYLYYWDWLAEQATISLNDERTEWLTDARLTNKTERKWLFDSLIGSPRPHRKYMLEYIADKSNILHSPIMETYKSIHAKCIKENTIFWEDDIEPWPKKPERYVKFMGRKMLPSQVFPSKVYNETWYTLVYETSISNRASFFTEKVAKPIVARRPFLVVSGQYYLKDLRSLGFKTFGHVIDESYDEIENSLSRMDAIIVEIDRLSKLDPIEVYASCEEIFDHNRNVLKSLASPFTIIDDTIEEFLINSIL